MKRRPIRNLSLGDCESQLSRLGFVHANAQQAETLLSEGNLQFGRSIRDRMFWSDLLKDDLLIVFTHEHPRHLYACRVVGKSIQSTQSAGYPDRPLILHIAVVGRADHFQLRHGSFFFPDHMVGPNRTEFELLWEQCQPIEVGSAKRHAAPNLCSEDGYIVRVASTHADNEFIADIAQRHPFGVRRAFLQLVAVHNEVPVGALVADLGVNTRHQHSAVWRVFRSDYPWIREHSVRVLRIYNGLGGGYPRHLHRVLLKALLSIAPILPEFPLTIVEGVSYDFLPGLVQLGFNVEIPVRFEGAFYYWMPFSVPSHVDVSSPDWRVASEVARELIAKRREVRYWLALATEKTVKIAVRKNGWAIRQGIPNKGRWRSLANGDNVFLVSEYGRIHAAGIVHRTAHREVKGFEEFPLWIDFRSPMWTDLNIDISSAFDEEWLGNEMQGGLVPLPNEYGAKVRLIAENQNKRGLMWVEPNPFLLHQTQFEQRRGQVFVVQSWDLRDTVLPIIRETLSQNGYTVKYSGDRGGQVVLDDIWLMLNESEVVLVDFTAKRPNVYLEYGMALVLGKPVVAITQSKEDIPSDTPNLKYIVYQDRLADTALRGELLRAMKDVIADLQRVRRTPVEPVQ